MPLLVNATPVPVVYRDGKTETIMLGELPLRQLYTFIKFLGADDTPSLVALCANKPVDWIDTLEDESFSALSKKAYELNFQRAVGRAASDPTAAARLAPLLIALAANAQLLGMNGNSGASSLPVPASEESAVETGNGSST